jgi:hypothetical protein
VLRRTNAFSLSFRILSLGLLVLSRPALAQEPSEESPPDTPAPSPPAPEPQPPVEASPPPPEPSPEIRLEGPLAAAPAIGYSEADVGSKVSENFVMPSGYAEIGGELALVTSGAVVTPRKLALGDLALFRPLARRSFSDELELSFSTTLLAKEPSGGHDWIWQGASLGALFEPSRGYGLVLGATGGPLLGGHGSFWSAAPGITRKWTLDRAARAVLSLSDAFTALDRHGELAARSWLDEVVLGGEIELGRDEGAFWVGANYAVPVAKHGEQPLLPGVRLRPATRLDLDVGGVWRVGEHDSWDLYAYYAWIDRGEASRPSTLLPVLDGGFDQQQVVLGIRHRFEPHADDTPHGGVRSY